MADANRELVHLVFGFIRRIENQIDQQIVVPEVIYEEIWRFHSVKLYIAGFMKLNNVERYFTLNYKNEMAYYYDKGDKHALESFFLSDVVSTTHRNTIIEITTSEYLWKIDCPSIKCRDDWLHAMDSLMKKKKRAANNKKIAAPKAKKQSIFKSFFK